jgi:rhodanese-related sulfurtransferase
MAVEPSLLSRFEPLRLMAMEHLVEVSAMSIVETVAIGTDLLHSIHEGAKFVYLLKGDIRLAYQDGGEAVLTAGTPAASHALGSDRKPLIFATTISEVEMVTVDGDLIDMMMTWEQVANYAMPAVSEGELWSSKNKRRSINHNMPMGAIGLFGVNKLQGGAFSRLPSANIDELYKRMVSVQARASDVIIRQGEEADYYYLIESGSAVVSRVSSPNEPPTILATLNEGDAFGEEANVSDSKRNATVTMRTDGVLLRLRKQDFVELLKEPLLNVIEYEQAEQKVTQGATWLDVRLPSEFEFDHLQTAINLPLHDLRSALNSLDRKKVYITYCLTGRRSSAAAFILSQHGFDVFTLKDGIGGREAQ